MNETVTIRKAIEDFFVAYGLSPKKYSNFVDDIEYCTLAREQDAYDRGVKEGQARMNNSGRLLFQQGQKTARIEMAEAIKKELSRNHRSAPLLEAQNKVIDSLLATLNQSK